MIRFINRKDELALLESDWKLKNSFVVVYGRRRIGKTRLIEEFVKDKEGIYYTAEDTSKKIQINELKSAFAKYLKDEFLIKQELSDWSSLFNYLAKVLSKKKKIYIWIDEFSYIIKNDSSITSILQKFIDKFLRKSKIFFIVSGSLFGLMSEKVLASSSPLYGRRTRDILMKSIPAQHIPKFLNMSFEDSLKTSITVGGVPEYLLVASRYKKYRDFVSNEFLKKNGYFYREAYFLLSQEFKEIKTYLSILNAIAYGNTKPIEIANFVGIKAREIYPYLDLLINYGFIKRFTSIFGNKKRGIYLIEDAFFDFWFNFVYKNREDIERDLCKLSSSELNTLLGKRFEIFIRENFNLFFKNFRKISKWWWKDKEIDIVALNKSTKEIIFAECKWQENIDAEKIIKELIKKTEYIEWNDKKNYAVFAKSFSKKIKEFQGKKVYCIDLQELDRVWQRFG